MSYAGLPASTPRFLAALEANNSRDWFEAHRDDYERDWLAAGLDLAAALSEPVSKWGLLAVPKLNSSLRRIHRDVRFSRDKRPYDPRLHLILSSGPAFNKVPGVHLVIGADGFSYGAGCYGLSAGALDHYRALIGDEDQRAEFHGLLALAGQVACQLDPPDMARVPRGCVAAEWDALIRRKSVIVRTQVAEPLPDWLFTDAAIEHLSEIAHALAPLTHWLAKL